MKSLQYLWPALKYSNKTLQFSRGAIPISLLRSYSSAKVNTDEVIIHEKIQLSKPAVTKWKRPPFLKNFFIGKFDTELCAFPEILDNEHLSELENTVKNLNEVMKQKADSITSTPGKIPEVIFEELKRMGLFGRLVPFKYGGLDLTYTACTRLNEVLGLDWSIFCSLAAHEFLATEAILKFGSEAQKSYYLPKMASGEIIGGFCCHERLSGTDLLSISTTASEMSDGSFIIDGAKSWVTNASSAGVFIVFAKTKKDVDTAISEVSAFIVDRDCEGVFVEPLNKSCFSGLESGVVHFRNVSVPSSNIIGGLGKAFPIFLKSMESFRIAQNSFTFGTLKALLDAVTERVIDIERLEESLADKQLIRCKLSKVNSTIYAMESLSYFTAALIDSTENPDVDLESAALKLFNSKATLFCLREMIDVVGSYTFTHDLQLEKLYRDAQALAMFDQPMNITKLYLSYSGLKVAGLFDAEEVVKIRNPFFYPKEVVRETYKRWRVSYGLFKYDQDIAGHLHPSLVGAANRLEEKIQMFDICVKAVLERHGSRVLFAQIEPSVLADIVADLYATAAVLSRCSRSYCIGLKNCHHELNLVNTFCADADTRVVDKLDSIVAGLDNNSEAKHLELGAQVVDCQGYFPEHPLKHNF